MYSHELLLTGAIRSSTTAVNEPSNYITELTRYLTNIIGSVLLGLPLEIKDFIYSDALNHAATNILVRLAPNRAEFLTDHPLDITTGSTPRPYSFLHLSSRPTQFLP